jgi:hypothetical protein
VVECPVCLRDVQPPPDAREGEIITCPYCKISFRLIWVNDQWIAERVESVA